MTGAFSGWARSGEGLPTSFQRWYNGISFDGPPLLRYNGSETPETDFKLFGMSSDSVSFYELRDGGNGLAHYEMEFLVPDFLKDDMLPIREIAQSTSSYHTPHL